DASGLVHERGGQVLDIELGVALVARLLLRGNERLLRLLRQFVRVNHSITFNLEPFAPLEQMAPDVLPAARFGDFARKLALFLAELGRHDDLHGAVEIPVPAARPGHPLARKTNALAVLHPRRDLHGEPSRGLAVLARDLDHLLGPLVCLWEGDLNFALDILALSSTRSRPRTCATEHIVRVAEAAVR